MSKEAYPLCWPEGYPRTLRADRTLGSAVFGYKWTQDRVRRLLEEEVRRLCGDYPLLSTMIALRQDGAPYATQKRIDDPGVAIYFMYGTREVAMACDRYFEIWANMRALALCIESLRRLERHGGGEILDRAFTGFAALPASIIPAVPWWTLLGWDDDQGGVHTRADVQEAYRRRLMECHPDKGGSQEAMADLNRAREQAIACAEDGA